MNEASANPKPDDPRLKALRLWLTEVLGTADYDLAPASSDASFRRYFRIALPDGSRIVMDAPPDKEDSSPFIRVADLLHEAGLHAPQVLASDLEQGFLLLTDLGNSLYIDVLREQNPDPLMEDALDALVQWQLASKPAVLPDYDAALLHRELALFPDWYVKHHLGREFSHAEQTQWQAVCERLVEAALAQPQVYVHRDFMPRNLMVSDPNPGIIDFQDAVLGPIAYDVLSLCKDAFLSWSAEKVDEWRQYYYQTAQLAGLPVGDAASFERAFDWIGLQRHLKVMGIFARICYRDGKPHYLGDVPRFIRYIREVLPKYPGLAALERLFDALGLDMDMAEASA